MAGAGQAEGLLRCVWMRGERGSPGSPSEMSLSLQAPETTCHSGATPFPQRLKSEMNLSEQFTTGRPIRLNGHQPHNCNLSVNSVQFYLYFIAKLIFINVYITLIHLHISIALHLWKFPLASCSPL